MEAQLGNVVRCGSPEDLPVQVEVGVYNPVPHAHDLPPGHFRMPLAEFRCELMNRLTDHRQVVEDGGLQDFVRKELRF